jgi:hypothetical protein
VAQEAHLQRRRQLQHVGCTLEWEPLRRPQLYRQALQQRCKPTKVKRSDRKERLDVSQVKKLHGATIGLPLELSTANVDALNQRTKYNKQPDGKLVRLREDVPLEF